MMEQLWWSDWSFRTRRTIDKYCLTNVRTWLYMMYVAVCGFSLMPCLAVLVKWWSSLHIHESPAFPASLYCSLPLRHDLCLTSQLSTALLYYSLTAWYYPHHSHLLPTTTRRFTSVHYHSNLPIPPPLFVTRRSISLLQLLPIITRLCLALHMQWSITLTTSNTSHKYLPLRIVAMASRIAPHYSLKRRHGCVLLSTNKALCNIVAYLPAAH